MNSVCLFILVYRIWPGALRSGPLFIANLEQAVSPRLRQRLSGLPLNCLAIVLSRLTTFLNNQPGGLGTHLIGCRSSKVAAR
jgi:hypothetical protein